MKTNLSLEERVDLARHTARWALGLVWVYEGLVPKLLFAHLRPEQTALVANSGLVWHSPLATLAVLGVLQTLLGLVLLSGWKARQAAAIATAFMTVLIVLVARGRPEMWIDPYGAFAKDLCLVACAAVLWLLPERAR